MYTDPHFLLLVTMPFQNSDFSPILAETYGLLQQTKMPTLMSQGQIFFCYLSKEGLFFSKTILGRHTNFYPFVTLERAQGAMLEFLSYLLGAPLKTPSLIATLFVPKREIAALFHSSQGRQQEKFMNCNYQLTHSGSFLKQESFIILFCATDSLKGLLSFNSRVSHHSQAPQEPTPGLPRWISKGTSRRSPALFGQP